LLLLAGLLMGGMYELGRLSVEVKEKTASVLPGKASDDRTKNAPQSSPVPAALQAAPSIPASPDPSWRKCPEDCGYGKFKPCSYKGHPQQDWVGFQGTCWATFKNPGWSAEPERRKPCFGTLWFNPPDDAPEELQKLCFIPVEQKAGSQPNVLKP